MTLSAFSVSDMHCARCAAKIEAALDGERSIIATFINPARKQVLIEHAESASPLDFLERLEAAGFHPLLATQSSEHAGGRELLKRLGVAGLAMMQVMMTSLALYSGQFVGIDESYRRLFELTGMLFCIPVVTYSAQPFLHGALRSLRSGLSMDVPIALAIVTAFMVSTYNMLSNAGQVYFESVTMFTFLLLLARYVDDRLKQRFEITNANLAALPATGLCMRDGQRERVPLVDIPVGARIWVEEGCQVPLDGRLCSTTASLDESILTGESREVRRTSGDPVFAGSLNRGAGFELVSTAGFSQSRLAGIAALANRAQAERPHIQQAADRIARWFVPGVLVLAALTWIIWELLDPSRAFVAMLTVLVVSCPCALSLATPAAITAAMTRLRQCGIVLTRSSALEALQAIDVVVFDKTGTLTRHQPALETIELLASAEYDRNRVLDLAAALQLHSSHPIARAFVAAAPHINAEIIENVKVVTGSGVEGVWHGRAIKIGQPEFCTPGAIAENCDTGVLLSIDGRPVARFHLDDPIRPDAQQTLIALRRAGIRTRMSSGDAPDRCRAVAERLGLDYAARQTPEDKLATIRDLQASGARVLAVGDGINDLPALAAADVSAAVLETTDLVRSKADVLLLNRRLASVLELLRTAHLAHRIMRQNLAWALGYNLIAVPLAACGYMVPWAAALGMASSSMLVMLNAGRLLRPADPPTEGP